MIKFELAGCNYVASFRHTLRKWEMKDGKRVLVEDPLPAELEAITECLVMKEDDGTPVMFAEAKCRKPDNFCRTTGRQIALGRAIAALQPEPAPPALDGSQNDERWLAAWRQERKALHAERKAILRRCK